ncbi:MAG: ABC transporter permease, partial [Thermoanaerobaculia bacterium]
MFSAITHFELKYHLKPPLFYILFASLFLLTFGAVTSDAVIIGGAVGAINRNAPFVIMLFLLVMSIFGVLTTTAFVANAAHRDFELGTDSLFFSAPIKKWQYLWGRFTGSFLVSVLLYVGVALAIVIGSMMPWIDKERLGPFEAWPYLFSLLVLVIPNLFLCGAIFFSVAAMTRSLMATYSSVVAFFVGWGIASSMLEDIENERLAALLDPFAFNATSIATRYWTVFDKNTKTLGLDGLLLTNRLLWVGVALVILAFAFWKFEFTTGTRKAAKKARRVEAKEVVAPAATAALPKVEQHFGGAASWKQYLAATRRESLLVFKSIPFFIILILGIANVWGGAVSLNSLFGTNRYPVTHAMVENIFDQFAIFALLIAAFYAGDIIWRERSLKIHEVHDAMPTPTWAIWASKATALAFVVVTTLFVATLTSIVIQLAKGFTKLEPLLYVKGVFLQVGGWLLLIAALAFLLQAFLGNKFLGFAGVMVWFIVMRILPAVGWEHRLYRF